MKEQLDISKFSYSKTINQDPSNIEDSADEEEDNVYQSDLKIKKDVRNLEYTLKTSTGSCYISDIQGFIYGGTTSRFWALRKHLNTLSNIDISKDKMPFYSWECITI